MTSGTFNPNPTPYVWLTCIDCGVEYLGSENTPPENARCHKHQSLFEKKENKRKTAIIKQALKKLSDEELELLWSPIICFGFQETLYKYGRKRRR